MGKIMLNGRQYGVGGIADASDVKYGSTDVESALDGLSRDLTSHYIELDVGSISSSSGSVVSNSIVRVTYNKHAVSVDYYIRVQNPDGRPTITISNFPNLPTTFTSTGFPTHARMGTTNFITDSSIFQHISGRTTATVTFYYYLGDFPTGSGYVVAAGNASWNY